jgi:2-phosphosulfolactate phosphatase
VRVRVELVPGLTAGLDAETRGWPGAAGRRAAVVIDVLRATTTLTAALAAGAARVLPVARPEEAFALKGDRPDALACGERGGIKVPGFDLGNSPEEYTGAAVAGRTLLFASTNGSLALLACAGSGRRLLGAFVNAAAVVEALAGERFVTLVCAGKEGRFSLEDAACAGFIAAALAARGATPDGGGARLALALAPRDAAGVRALVQGCSHGRYLRSLGGPFARDVEFCGALDRFGQAFEI